MEKTIPELDRRGLRNFGLVFGFLLTGIFGCGLPLFFQWPFTIWPWVAGGFFIVIAMAIPQKLRSFYRLWMRFGLIINAIITPFILSVVFVLLIIPFALTFRLLGKDPMHRRLERGIASYRRQSAAIKDSNLERLF